MSGARDPSTLAALGRISRSVAHDFNNALTSILSSAELLAEDTDRDDPRSRDIARIRRACLRARALTVQLLEVTESRPSAPRRVTLDAHLAERRVLFEKAMGGENTLEITGGGGMVAVDLQELDNTLLRLAINAGTVMRGGTWKVSVDVEHGEVVLRARDYGAPVEEEELAFVFDPSVGQSYTLAGVYTFARAHGGSVELQPKDDGNLVVLRLPVARDP